jgi:glycosyltransferase involved in cell wall biosynthesis
MPPLNILYIAYPLLTVSDEAAGGAEQVLWTLEREMARAGVHTTVAASQGSCVSGKLFSTGAPCTQPDDFERRNREHQERIVELVRWSARKGRGFDLVHDMSGSFWTRASEVDLPILATLHLPRSFYPAENFHQVAPNVSFNCVSRSQAGSFSDLGNLLGVVPNGIALDLFEQAHRMEGRAGAAGRSGLLWLGRICQEKAPHLALEIAARAGLPLTMAGKVYPFSYHQQYFEREVAPRLEQMPDVTFLPSPPASMKLKLLREAQALLITSQADETSSLVAMEAAASGTPVIAFRRGALPEVVRDQVTGFVVENAGEAIEACRQAPSLSPARCAGWARENFSSRQMAEGYHRLYARLLSFCGAAAVP